MRCKTRKTRCDGLTPSCTFCSHRRLECVYQPFQKRRGLGKRSRFCYHFGYQADCFRSKSHVQDLESRLNRMEALLHRSTVPDTHSSLRHDQVQDVPNTNARPNIGNMSIFPQTTRIAISRNNNDPRDNRSFAQTSESSESSSRKTLVALNTEENISSLIDSRDTRCELAGNSSELYHGGFRAQRFAPMMNGEAIKEFLIPILDDINSVYPIFDSSVLQATLTQPASNENVERWAYLNALLGLGHLHGASNDQYLESRRTAWAFFKNSFASFPHLLVHGRSLLTIEAVLCMALFLGRSTDKRTTSLLVASALNIYSTLFFSTENLDSKSDTIAIHRKKKAFWTAYILDKNLSLNCGILPSVNDDEVRPDIPEEISTQQREFSIFSHRCNLAVIQSTIYQRLYKTAKKNHNPADLLGSINVMEIGLKIWKDTLPHGVRPYFDDISTEVALPFHLLSLLLSYHNAIGMALRPAKRSNSWISFSKRYTMAAGNTLRWAKNINSYSFPDIW